MPRLRGRLPSYRRHRASGQAVVTLNGRDHYLGPHGTKSSYDLYDRLIAEWLANGRQHADCEPQAPTLTVEELIHAYWKHAEGYYRRADGTPSSELDNYRQALRLLRRLYGKTDAADFGPRALKAVREQLIRQGLCRASINRRIQRICSVFQWAVAEEMLPVEVHQRLKTLTPLRRGRCEAVEPEPRGPVPQQLIHAIQPHVSEQVWALIQLQLCTGARAGELLQVRPADIDRSGNPWVYELKDHKTAHHGHGRVLYFGPRCQEILLPFLEGRDESAYLFSPREAEQQRRRRQHAARQTPIDRGNRPGSNRRRKPKWSPGDHYTVASYRRAIHRGCDLAFPPPANLARQRQGSDGRGRWETESQWRERLGPDKWKQLQDWQRRHRWSPHRLRKNAATEIRRQYGVEMSKIILGHRSIAVNEIYAQRDEQQARVVMGQIG